MNYILSFLEGIITFISPCLLPMLPIYISFLAGQETDKSKKIVLQNAFGFTLGFTIVFVFLGAFAGSIGKILKEYSTIFNIISGSIVILFGLNFTGLINIKLLNTNRQLQMKMKNLNFFSSVLFGIIFSIGWTPCVGAFLGSALMLAAQSGESLKGVIMLLCYSLGLGIPFIISAVLIEHLKDTFSFIKKNYNTITFISGLFLIVIGIMMVFGILGKFLALLTF